MARAATLGNGNLLVGLDARGQVRDLYFPFVGQSNHVSGASGNFAHRIGVFIDGQLSWLSDEGWTITVGCNPETLVSTMTAVHDGLGVVIESTDAVHNEQNVFIRSLTVHNNFSEAREIKVFFSQQFRISESGRGDTGLYDPRVNAIIHYKGHIKILVNAFQGEHQFTDYNIGLFAIEGKEGTFHDATDGVLERNPIEHGSVDSVIGVTCKLSGQSSTVVNYWIACARTVDEVHDVDAFVRKETPEQVINSSADYWYAWITKDQRSMPQLTDEMRVLYERSLTTMRVHVDNRGGIIASSDTDMLHHGRDTYSYVWPRDGAIVAHAFDVAGYGDVSKRFYSFMAERLERGGYFMHKYLTDGSLGSSWHPWIIDGEPEFPIQEDETALVVYMLYQHYLLAHDLEYIESLYNPFIEPAANFMVEFIESRLGLPQNSFDLWEEKFGISTYTASAVFGALTAASQFAGLLGKTEAARTYSAVAQRIQSGILNELYDKKEGMFIKLIRARETEADSKDMTLDMSSFFGPLYFGVVEVDDARVAKCFKAVEARLATAGQSKGYMRYEGDNYYKMHDAESPNPWIVTTLWVAQYYIAKAKTVAELKPAYEILDWTVSHATVAGVLAEQMHPRTREHLSTAPLVWSHAEYVLTVNAYLQRHKELSG